MFTGLIVLFTIEQGVKKVFEKCSKISNLPAHSIDWLAPQITTNSQPISAPLSVQYRVTYDDPYQLFSSHLCYNQCGYKVLM
jgi:hypothetical protein